MEILLRPLKTKEDDSVFEVFDDIPEEENGFMNKMHGVSREVFDSMTLAAFEESVSKRLQKGRVPQTYYILFVDNVPVGFSKLRHFLTPRLLEHGGHIGLGISPKFRGNGYAKRLLCHLPFLKSGQSLKILL